MKTQLLILIFALMGVMTSKSAQAQTYDPLAVQRINDLIANNSLQATPNAPETWGFAHWNNETPKKIIELQLNIPGGGVGYMNGAASFADLTTLQVLNCNWGSLTKVDVSNCTQLITLKCADNRIEEINLTNCTQLQTLICGQNRQLAKLEVTHCTQIQYLSCMSNGLINLDVTSCTQLQFLSCTNNGLIELDLIGLDKLTEFDGSDQSRRITLYKNETGEYTCAISLNNPTFESSAISYSDGLLKSIDTTVWVTDFTVQTTKENFELSGHIYFDYSTVGAVTIIDDVQLMVYPNPNKGQLIINNEKLLIIKSIDIFDISGKIVSSHHPNISLSNQNIDISNLNAGIYFVKITTDAGEVTKEIIKQ